MTELTPFQTLGPFFSFALPFDGGDTIAVDATAGRHVAVDGTIRDGADQPVSDAIVEIWQANAAGKYRHPADQRDAPLDPTFDGFGRIATDDGGGFAFTTVFPGRVRGPGDALQAPHLLVGILARGILTRLVTRMYFEDEPSNGEDSVLARVPVERRPTLVARRVGSERYHFDVVLQGRGETVFFDV